MYSAAIKRRVLDMACHGVSYCEIERTLGVSHATVSKWARAAGIKRGTDSGRDIAALSKRLMEVMEAIDALPDPEAEASPLDAAKRKRGGV